MNQGKKGTSDLAIKRRRSAPSASSSTSLTLGANSAPEQLANWFAQNCRPLPWRQTRDPYAIWISEVMLQQTRVQAMLPFFERFMERFPTLDVLAKAPLPEVLRLWSGLGYYSRARSLHQAAKDLVENWHGEFPRTHSELLTLPGFGPYTARAVASLAFGERTGVVDGNVIRVLSRWLGKKIPWWKPQGRSYLQDLADQWVRSNDPWVVNQAVMELGATICLPRSPLCTRCPLITTCKATQTGKWSQLPVRKPKRQSEVWIWRPQVEIRGKRVALQKSEQAPFLRNQLLFPGEFLQKSRAPARYDLRHAITHHDIYIQLRRPVDFKHSSIKWVPLSQLSSVSPSSLLPKILRHFTDEIPKDSGPLFSQGPTKQHAKRERSKNR